MKDAGVPPEEARENLPHFLKTARSPRLPDVTGRIALATDPPRAAAEGPTWPLRGSFRVPRPDVADGSILRRIVLALTSGASHVTQARHAVTDVVIFDDDVTALGTDIAGFFTVDLADLFELQNRQEIFHILASIGPYVSEVLTCDVELPWIDWPRGLPLEAEEDEGPGGDEGDDERPDDDAWQIEDDPAVEV